MAIMKFAIRHKRLVSVLLILCVVLFNIYAMQQEAHASAVVIGGVALLIAFTVTALVAWGVTFSSQQAAQQAAENIVYDTTYDANADGYNDYIVDAATTGHAVYDVVTGAYKWVSRIADEDLQWWRDYIHSHYTAGANIKNVQFTQSVSEGSYDNSSLAYYDSNEFLASLSSGFQSVISYYNLTSITGVYWIATVHSENSTWYSIYKASSVTINSDGSITFYREGVYEILNGTYYFTSIGSYDTFASGAYQVNLGTLEGEDTGVYVDPDIYNDNTYTPTNSKTGEPDIPCDVYPVPGDTTGDITLADGTGFVVDQEQIISDVVGKNPDYVLDKDIVGVPVLVQVPDLALNPDEAVNDTQTAENAMTADETQTSLKGLFISKFPFCIPWDLANAFKLIAAPAEAPHFEIDFLAPLDDTVHFQGSTEIDFDMADYPLIGQVCRWCFTIEFCIALMLATRKVMKW